MKLLEEKISNYHGAYEHYALLDESDKNSIYFFTDFDLEEFEDELAYLTDHIEKIQLLQFIIRLIDKDINDIESKCKIFKSILKNDTTKERQDLKDDLEIHLEELIKVKVQKIFVRAFKNNEKFLKFYKPSYSEKIENKPVENSIKLSETISVQWRGNDSDLYYLLNELQNNGFITDIDKKTLLN